jgi:hypothetical protein
MVLVKVGGNYIDAEPMKNKSAGSMIKAYIALWKRLTATGVIQSKTHLLNNEASAELKSEIKKNCKIQLVSPNNHRQNIAERAIQTFKNHFKAILAGVDDSFPMQLWDNLLPQTVLTLNLLQQSNVAPTVLAYQYVHRNFDYNKMPLAPLRWAVQLYKSNTRRGTWAEHSTDGWYLGTSNKHYQCHKIYVKKTRSKRISDMVFFKRKYITQPTLMQADIIVKALDNLTHTLKGRKNVKSDTQIEALEQIDELLNNIPRKGVTRKEQHVSFDENTAPPQETNTTPRTLTTTQQTAIQKSIEKATIDKSISNQTPTPRVQTQINKQQMMIPQTPRVHSKPKDNTLPEQT